MKRPFLVMVLIILPLSFFAVAFQSYQFEQKEARVDDLLIRQRDLFEENKRLIAKLSALEAPKTVVERAMKELGMKFPDQSQVIKLKTGEAQNGN